MKPDANNPGLFNPEQIPGPIKVAENGPQVPASGHPPAPNKALPSSNNGNIASPPPPIKPPEGQKTPFETQLEQMNAEDADIIEKGWVDQADYVIRGTADDPYHKDQGHHALAKHYLKSRFNLDLDN